MGRQRYLILFLATSSLGLALVDRAAVSIAAPSMSASLGLDAVATGWLLSAFTWSYVVGQLPAGWIVDRLGARYAVLVCLLAWAAASAAVGLSGWLGCGLGFLVVMRVLVGVLQAPIVPAAGLSIAAWFPTSERGIAGALFGSSNYLALALFTPLLGWLTERHGWPAMFLFQALVILALAAAWWFNFHMPRRHPRVTPAEIAHISEGGAAVDLGVRSKTGSSGSLFDLRQILRNRMVIGILVSQYGISAVTWFYVSWFPTYLVQGRGMTLVQAGSVTAILALFGFAGGVSAGWFSDRVLKRSGSLSLARKLPVFIGSGLMLVGFAACTVVASNELAVVFLALAMFGKGFATIVWTLVADVFPPRAIGMAGGVVNTVSNVSGIVTTVGIGYLVAATGAFDAALWLLVGHAALALLSHALLVRKLAPLLIESQHRLPA